MIFHFSFFDCSSPLYYVFVIVIFPYLIKYYHIMVINSTFSLGSDRCQDFFFFVPALLLSMLSPLFLPSPYVYLSYFILAVPMCKCLGKHSCISNSFLIAILNGT